MFKIKKIVMMVLGGILFVGTTLVHAQSIVLNEVMASNKNTITDSDYNQFVDWIELKNTTTQSISLNGYYLTDDPQEPQKWPFSGDASIGAGQVKLVWADGLNKDLHTNFKLNNSGEWVALVNSSGVIVDSLSYDNIPADVSFGRTVDNSVKGYFASPTPNQQNNTKMFASNRTSSPPDFSLSSGVYRSGNSVSISAPANATVYFTRDGSVPTENSTRYTSPFVLNDNTIIRALCVENGLLPSDVITRSYIVDFDSALPVVSLVTQPDYLWDENIGIYVDHNIDERKDWERSSVLELFEPQSNAGFSIETDMRLFGRTAICIPQKSLSFFTDKQLNYPIFPDHPVSTFNSFLLRSSSDDWDDTMFADGFMQRLVEQNFNLDIQAFRPSVLFLNGEYWGIHNFREKYNEDYLYQHHGVDPQNVDLLYVDYRADDITVLAGDADGYYDMIDYIQNTDLSITTNYEQLKTMFDVGNYIDYIILESYIANVSWAHNMRIWRPKTPGGKWQWLVFDLDRGMKEASDRTLSEIVGQSDIFSDLMANTEFRTQFVNRALYHINNSFQPDNILALMSPFEKAIENEMPRHIEKWASECGNGVCGVSSISEWQDNINALKRFAYARPDYYLDELDRVFDLGSTVQVNVNVSPNGFGNVRVNNQFNVTSEFNGNFETGESVQLTAQPNPGFLFDAWKTASDGSINLVPQGAAWTYRDLRDAPDASWNQLNFNDSAWPSGRAQLGYGDGDEVTQIGYGGNGNDKNITAWFRHKFNISNMSEITGLRLRLLRDDGAVVYLNGAEVLRSNMPDGTITADTRADGTTSNENDWLEYVLEKDAVQSGENILAVEVHQASSSSSDLSFDCELFAERPSSGGDIISAQPTLTLSLDQDVNLAAVFKTDVSHVLPTAINSDLRLTAANSPYIITHDVTVSPNVKLTMDAGSDILFAENTSLIIEGALLGNGTAEHPIHMSAIAPGARWGGLVLSNTTALSTIKYLVIDGATSPGSQSWQTAAISTQNADLQLLAVDILNVNDPFSASGGNITIQNCRLDGSHANDDLLHIINATALIEGCELWGDGEVDFDYVDDSIIRNNTIRIASSNTNQDAFDLGSSKNVLIEGNTILNATDRGVSIGENSTTTIRRNVIVNCHSGVAVKDNSSAEIINNTFYQNFYAINAYEKTAGMGGATANAVNNIFAASLDSDLNTDDKSTITARYSLSTSQAGPGTGNFVADPLFVDANNLDFHIYASSPARDAGDPGSPNDPDGTRADIGALYYDASPRAFPVALNEICASNTSVIADAAGEFDDWIELTNTGTEPFDISGLYLTDNEKDVQKWKIVSAQPNETIIQPGGFLVIWMDGDVGQDGLHASFKLSAGGEELGLYYVYAGDTTQIDYIRFGSMAENSSFGRKPDGDGVWTTFTKPTPGKSNTVISSTEQNILPENYALLQNYPNPFNPQTVIRFAVPTASYVRLTITDVLGRHVKTLVDGEQSAGWHSQQWDGTNDNQLQVSAGVYFYRIESSNGFHDVKKMMFLK